MFIFTLCRCERCHDGMYVVSGGGVENLYRNLEVVISFLMRWKLEMRYFVLRL